MFQWLFKFCICVLWWQKWKLVTRLTLSCCLYLGYLKWIWKMVNVKKCWFTYSERLEFLTYSSHLTAINCLPMKKKYYSFHFSNRKLLRFWRMVLVYNMCVLYSYQLFWWKTSTSMKWRIFLNLFGFRDICSLEMKVFFSYLYCYMFTGSIVRTDWDGILDLDLLKRQFISGQNRIILKDIIYFDFYHCLNCIVFVKYKVKYSLPLV